jgi:hypothetical protein
MIKLLMILPLLFLAACGGDNDKPRSTPRPPAIDADTLWWVGAPSARPIMGNVVDIPAEGKANYVTRKCDLEGKQEISLTFSLNGPILSATPPIGPGLVTLYLQRKGDNWTGVGEYETFRWYATGSTITTNGAGTYTITAKLSDRWTAIQLSNSYSSPHKFYEAKQDCDRMGFVLGGGTGYGHGVTGPATLTILDYSVR